MPERAEPQDPARRTAAPAYDVRLARPGEEQAICDICRAGFALSSQGLLSPRTISRQSEIYYAPQRVAHEIATAGQERRWQGYVVAATADALLGAAGGGVDEDGRGHVLVLYLDPPVRGRGIGSALLDAVTEQQRSLGANEQWVSVTDGNQLGIPFYLARGFELRDRVPYALEDDGTVEAWSLRLSRAI